MKKIDQTSTVESFIKMRSSDEITYYNFSILEYMNGIELPISNIIYDYLDELKDESVEYTLTDDQYDRYQYRPYLLAYDFYGATELSFVILALNGIIDEDEFDIKTIKLLPMNAISSLLGQIFSVEQTYLNTNRSKIKEEEKKDRNKTVGL